MLDFVALNYLGRGGNLSRNVNRGQLMESQRALLGTFNQELSEYYSSDINLPTNSYNNPNIATVGQNLREMYNAGENTKGLGIMIVLYILIWIFAIYRALQCKNNMRVIHLFFATMNPILYLIFSFTVKDFCPK